MLIAKGVPTPRASGSGGRDLACCGGSVAAPVEGRSARISHCLRARTRSVDSDTRNCLPLEQRQINTFEFIAHPNQHVLSMRKAPSDRALQRMASFESDQNRAADQAISWRATLVAFS